MVRPTNTALLIHAGWMAILVVPFVFIALMDYRIDHARKIDSRWQVQDARALKSNAVDASQLPNTGWQEVKLTNRQTGDAPSPRSVWYRLEVESDGETSGLWAVYIPRPSGNYSVSINGKFVATTGPIELPIARYVVPIILKFPGALLHTGTNTVDINAVRERQWPTLGQTYVGPDLLLTPAYEAAFLWAVSVKQITVICMLAMSLMMAALYGLRRRDPAIGWYALALFFWAVHISIKLVPRAPFPSTLLWANIPGIAMGGYLICKCCFVNRFIGIKSVIVERWFMAWALFGAIVLVVDPLVFDYRLPWFYDHAWLPPIVVWATYQTWRLLLAARDRQHLEARLFAVVCWWVTVVGLRDGFMGLGVLRSRPQYLTYVIGPVLIVLGLVLVRRFVKAADAVESAREDLEARVAEKTVALERNLVRLKDLEREQALSAERERIMRDMHDGVGGQLVQALSIAGSRPELKPLEGPLRLCLEELRLIIDSIEPVDGDLASVLGTLRMRMSHRLTAAGVRVHWQVEDIPMLTNFGPQRVLQVTRVLQEAVANALKHSHAKNIVVRSFVVDAVADNESRKRIVLEIADDGTGFVAPASGGRGLSSMRHRAEDLGARFTIQSAATGTTVRLEISVETRTSEAPIAAQFPPQRIESDA